MPKPQCYMEYQDPQNPPIIDPLEQLSAENKALKAKLTEYQVKEELFKSTAMKKFRTKFFLGKEAISLYLGKNLTQSTTDLFDEISKMSVTTNTMGRVSAHIIARFIRVSMFTILFAIIPLLFICLQTFLLNRQNTLLERQNTLIVQQNDKIDRQSQLIESQRRNALIFELGNVLDAIRDETESGKDHTISHQLIGRIEALSRSLKPYKYLEGDSLSAELSPERGQLLISLLGSGLDHITLDSIKMASLFRRADLKEAYLPYVDLSNTHLEYANLSGADLHNAHLERTYLSQADLSNARLEASYLIDVELSETDLRNANLEGAMVGSMTWFEELSQLEHPPKGLKELQAIYRIDTTAYRTHFDSIVYKIVRR